MRVWALVLAAILLIPAAGASAHSVTMAAAVSTSGDEVTVRLIDPYGAAVEGAVTSIGFSAPDRPPGRLNRLQEREKGRFVGPIRAPESELYDITVEVTWAGDTLRSSIRARAGEDLSEVILPLEVVLHPGGINWSLYIYIGAAAVVLMATGLALMKRRGPEEEEAEGDGA